eukprot:6357-Eustigmatos_ZCMA.PRE.1
MDEGGGGGEDSREGITADASDVQESRLAWPGLPNNECPCGELRLYAGPGSGCWQSEGLSLCAAA